MKQEPSKLSQWSDDLEMEALKFAAADTGINRPVAEPISLASVWQMASPEAADTALDGQPGVYVYRRDGHPNEQSLARKLGRLHGQERALLSAQGMSSLGAVALALLQPGRSVWIAEELYGKSVTLFAKELQRWGVHCQQFDPTQEQHLKELAATSCDLVLVETISNPRLGVCDLENVAKATHSASAKLLVDNTFATHLICQPLRHGADIVVESLGKLVNGHSDAMLGSIVTNSQDLHQRISAAISTYGMASSPLDCFLTQRGLSTLALRLERACQNALALAQSLGSLTPVQHADYPGLEQHPQHELASRQFRGGYGWMVTMHLDLDSAAVSRLFQLLGPELVFAPSLGDIATSLSHPESTSHRGFDAQTRQRLGITTGTIRISCGIEPTEWLVEKFHQAIQRL